MIVERYIWTRGIEILSRWLYSTREDYLQAKKREEKGERKKKVKREWYLTKERLEK